MSPWVQRLLIANVIMYFVQQTVPGIEQSLALYPAGMLLRPWTMITYMFLHGGLGHIFFNMLGLYFFGVRVEERLGPQRFFSLYFLSGITGALLSFVFSRYTWIIGASGAIYGVMMAYAQFWPRDKFLVWGIIPVEVRVMVIIYTLISLVGVGGGVAHMAHLGGFLGGFLYLRFLSYNAAGKAFQRKVQAAPPVKAITDWSKVDTSTIHEVNRDEVNRILDKISAEGLNSLTPQERVFLSNFVPMDDRRV